MRLLAAFAAACLMLPAAGGQACAGEAGAPERTSEAAGLLVGWASADLTPDRPVSIQGQMYARVSEGVQDPITVTVLALEARPRGGGAGDRVVMVSCDLISIPDELRDAVRKRLEEQVPDLDPLKVFIGATHTHTAPEVRPGRWEGLGVDLGVMPASEYIAMAAGKIADTAARAWKARSPGGFSFGLGHAVVGRNRLVTGFDGRSGMYGKTGGPNFSHMEGYEDHLRLGDVAFATNPFEYYLDYGCRIKARSKAVQTFVVQLAGGGTYLPTERAVAGGAYGSVPASTTVGPDGGRELAERTVQLIDGLWARR